jgi:hypothetical protein
VGKKKELLEGIRDLDIIDEGRRLVEEERMRKIDMAKELEKNASFLGGKMETEISCFVAEGGGQ